MVYPVATIVRIRYRITVPLHYRAVLASYIYVCVCVYPDQFVIHN